MRDEKENISYTQVLKALTPREIEILELVGKGYTSEKIAATLSIFVTVHTHRKHIKKKLNLTGYRRLIRWY